jgi:2-polyprenyl-3-methyl-5-hydroxy-6-metoxy-1,4-benzoquinol methylase
VRWLDSGGEAADYYSSVQYIQEFDGSEDIENYFSIHDPVQLRHLGWVGTGTFRNKTVVDIGCGAGAFLDFVKGVATQTIGIDLNEVFVSRLVSQGHKAYQSISEVDAEFKCGVDILSAFSMIEHVEDPLALAIELHELAHPRTRLIMSTPNADEFLLEYLPATYKQFFYRKVHLWYFNERSLKFLLQKAGWKVEKVHYLQRFGLSNFISWVKESRPSGDAELPFVSTTMSDCWRSELCSQKVSDYFCIEAVPA